MLKKFATLFKYYNVSNFDILGTGQFEIPLLDLCLIQNCRAKQTWTDRRRAL